MTTTDPNSSCQYQLLCCNLLLTVDHKWFIPFLYHENFSLYRNDMEWKIVFTVSHSKCSRYLPLLQQTSTTISARFGGQYKSTPLSKKVQHFWTSLNSQVGLLPKVMKKIDSKNKNLFAIGSLFITKITLRNGQIVYVQIFSQQVI